MIDLVYKTLQTIINKENNGYVSPTEFNILANNVQSEIFRGYFEDQNRDKNKENRGLTNKGYANLAFNERQRINQFSDSILISKSVDRFNLPPDLYFIEDDGVLKDGSSNAGVILGNVVEEVEKNNIGYLNRSIAQPTETYPIYESYGSYIQVYPDTITRVRIRYLRKPKPPKWTYTVVMNKELFDPSKSDYQDFELHESEFSNIVLRMLSFFSINIRENEVVQIAEALKNKLEIKDNG